LISPDNYSQFRSIRIGRSVYPGSNIDIIVVVVGVGVLTKVKNVGDLKRRRVA
jgi:hypothetical protein